MESEIPLPGFLFIGPVRVSRALEDPTTYNRSGKQVLPRGMNGGLPCRLGRRAVLPEPDSRVFQDQEEREFEGEEGLCSADPS